MQHGLFVLSNMQEQSGPSRDKVSLTDNGTGCVGIIDYQKNMKTAPYCLILIVVKGSYTMDNI